MTELEEFHCDIPDDSDQNSDSDDSSSDGSTMQNDDAVNVLALLVQNSARYPSLKRLMLEHWEWPVSLDNALVECRFGICKSQSRGAYVVRHSSCTRRIAGKFYVATFKATSRF